MPRSPRNAISVLATSLRTRRRRPAVLALFGFLLLAQAALVIHRIDHNNAEHTIACALCVAADHSAAVPGTAVLALVPSLPEAVSAVVTEPTIPALIIYYRSRAPPSLLLT